MKIYFLGICGTAMGNTAVLMKQLGHDVCGSDSQFYSPISDLLKRHNIPTFEGFSAENLIRAEPDCVVVGNTVSRGNPEVEFLMEENAEMTSLPALLSDLLLKTRKNIVVTGTHGKTTTTTLAAFLLRKNGRFPGYLIGGIPKKLDSGVAAGISSDPFVIEGDEYDSAFFDKRSKFIHYRPNILCINNIEFDHADIFFDLRDVLRTFTHVTRLVPASGAIVINGDDANIARLPLATWTQTVRVGLGDTCDLQIRHFSENSQGSSFELYWRGQLWTRVSWSMVGLFNVRNAAMAALSAGLSIFPQNPTLLNLSALSQFQGVKKRQEVLFTDDDTVLIEDFGHHPTAIQQTLQSLRARYPQHRIVACFEPRSNTARSNCLQSDFENALMAADTIYLSPVYASNRLEQPLDTRQMAQKLTLCGREAMALSHNNDLLTLLKPPMNNTLVVFFSNGSFDGIPQKVRCELMNAPKEVVC
ncbi:MAG: hypothetical protein A2Y14_05970 [Verrucomicrobia bacterium GWF2_51_19]|nr:MAG: hypothetical protein A2Y14_05970 [Verrucomicrobia bacterium GWF2_51_19]